MIVRYKCELFGSVRYGGFTDNYITSEKRSFFN